MTNRRNCVSNLVKIKISVYRRVSNFHLIKINSLEVVQLILYRDDIGT